MDKVLYTQSEWRSEYRGAFIVTSIYFVSSLICYAAFPNSREIAALNSLIYFGAALFAAYRMANGIGSLSALTFFLVGSGIFFGAGLFITFYVSEANIYLSDGQQDHILSKVSLVNSLSIFIIVACAGIVCRNALPFSAECKGLYSVSNKIFIFTSIIIPLGFTLHTLAWITFPNVKDPLIHGMFRIIDLIVLLSIFSGGIVFHRIRNSWKLLTLILTILFFTEGLLSLSKQVMLFPLLSLGAGLWLGGVKRFLSVSVFATGVMLYFFFMMAVVPLGRGHDNYMPQHNSIAERAVIIIEVVTSFSNISLDYRQRKAFARFSPTQFSAFFIEQYDRNMPGDSLDQAKYVLIPRIIWEDKPEISPGAYFDMVWRDGYSNSGLGIGFPAEAYWNYGWIGVLLVSIYIGIMIGIFTKLWIKFQVFGFPYIGIFVCCAFIIKSGLWVESSIVGSYVGGMIKILFLVYMLNIVSTLIILLYREVEERRRVMEPYMINHKDC